MAVRLEFLTQTPEEIALATRYWAMDEEGLYLEKVNELVPFGKIKKVGLVAKYVRTLCQAFDENQVCYMCEGPILIASRSDAKLQFQRSNRPCKSCSENLQEEGLERKREAQNELQKQLNSRISQMRNVSISYADLKDDQRFILLAIGALITTSLADSKFTEGNCDALSPWESRAYLTRLCRAGVIFDDPEAAIPGTYSFREGVLHADRGSLKYFLPPDELLGRGDEALESITEQPFTDPAAMTSLWLDYAVGDVLRYLMDQCRIYSHDLNNEDIEKIKGTIRSGLHTYSVSQLWFVMWKVAKDAASLAVREYYNRPKATATIPNKIRKQIEIADKQGGIDKYWDRPELHIAGSMGMAFLTLFGIDEFTSGKNALEIFAQLSPQEAAEEVQGMACDFMQGALSRNVPLWAMEQFAKLIRAGFDTNGALYELVRLNPEIFSATNG